MNEEEIRSRIAGINPEILDQSLQFINEKLELERSRSLRAEERAAIVLAVVGILTAFVVQFTQLLVSPGENGWLILVALYLASTIFLVKAGLFALRALWVTRSYEITPELVFDLRSLSKEEALQEEIVWKMWEYYQLVPSGSVRLFHVHRAQRNILAAIVSLALLGLAWFILVILEISAAPAIGVIVLIIVVGFLILLDIVFERKGTLWQFQ